MDMLSSTYKKASEVAHKSARATLSLLLVITAFLGFNSLTGNEANVSNFSEITSAPRSADPTVTASAPTDLNTPDAVVEAPVIDSGVSKPITSAVSVVGITRSEYEGQMAISMAQLESAGTMLEALKLIEESSPHDSE
jgi:hypothetical protein